jgi:hypothetical protein
MPTIRRPEDPDSVDAVLADLKKARQRGGVSAASADDLLALTGLLRDRGVIDPDECLLAARDAVMTAGHRVVNGIIDDSEADGRQRDQLYLGAMAVERVLLRDPPDKTKLETKRRMLAGDVGTSVETLRTYEDQVLRLIAESIWRSYRREPKTADTAVGLDLAPVAKPGEAAAGELLAMVTGISGTAVKASLRTYCQERDIELIQLERTLVLVAESMFPDELSYAESGRTKLMVLLGFPAIVLREIWETAWKQTVQAVRDLIDLGRNVILTLHATSYHLKSQSVISLLQPEVVRSSDLKPNVVVQLVDDCFDSLARLIVRPDSLFYGEYDKGDDIAPMLVRLLQWREAETLATEVLARVVSRDDAPIPFVVFAVKHPIETFEKLLSVSPERYAYLSHPIAKGYDGDLRNHIDAVTTELRGLSDLVIFEPTTIDEFRFDSGDASGFHLRERWIGYEQLSANDAELLWTPLTEDEVRIATQPFETASTRDNARDLEPGELHLLGQVLMRQVKARDLRLVEQSSHVLCLRPFGQPDGTIAGGVKVECEHQVRLAHFYSQTGRPGKSVPLIYHPEEDELRRLQSTMMAYLRRLASQQLLTRWDEATAEKITKEINEFPYQELLDPNISDTAIAEKLLRVFRDSFPFGSRPDFAPEPSLATMSVGDETASRPREKARAGREIRLIVLGRAGGYQGYKGWFADAVVRSDRLSAGQLVGAFEEHVRASHLVS